MSSDSQTPQQLSAEAERVRKADKKARKAEKRAREAAATAEAEAQAAAEEPRKKKEKKDKKDKKEKKKEQQAEEEPQASPIAVSNLDEEALRKEEKKKRKAEKKARKAAEAAAAAAASSPASSPAASPSPSPVAAASTSYSWSDADASSAPAASPLTPARKNFYRQHADLASMADKDVEAVRAKHKMTLTGNMYGLERSYAPVTRFDQAGFDPALLKATTAGFAAPSGIQSQCWPVLLSGRDAIAIAETGSGKTLGFVLPALAHLQRQKPVDTSLRKGNRGNLDNMGPLALVLAPTRELAMQSAEVAEKAAAAVGMRTACIYGGVERHVQRSAVSKGLHLLVATPGRLLSMLKDGDISLARVTLLVLDEADRMLDLGFEADIRAIIGQCPGSQERQTLMFSATWPESVRKLAAEFIVDPLRITIGKDEEQLQSDSLAANKRIKQTVEVIDDFKRDARLVQILQEHTKGSQPGQHKKILVFVLYKKEVDRVERMLRQRGFQAEAMSSDKSQADRVAALEKFKSGQARMLVATDVAGRGLDINDIALVVNYSFPLTIEDYVHRIGRTGRGGKSGESVTFFTRNDKHLSGELINVLREADQLVPEELMKFGTGVKRKAHGMYGAHFKPTDDGQPMKKAVKVVFD